MLPKLQTPGHNVELIWGRDVWFDKSYWFRSENTSSLLSLLKGFFASLQTIASRNNQTIVLRTGDLNDGETHPFLFNIQDYFEDKTLTLLKREDTRAKDILFNI